MAVDSTQCPSCGKRITLTKALTAAAPEEILGRLAHDGPPRRVRRREPPVVDRLQGVEMVLEQRRRLWAPLRGHAEGSSVGTAARRSASCCCAGYLQKASVKLSRDLDTRPQLAGRIFSPRCSRIVRAHEGIRVSSTAIDARAELRHGSARAVGSRRFPDSSRARHGVG